MSESKQLVDVLVGALKPMATDRVIRELHEADKIVALMLDCPEASAHIMAACCFLRPDIKLPQYIHDKITCYGIKLPCGILTEEEMVEKINRMLREEAITQEEAKATLEEVRRYAKSTVQQPTFVPGKDTVQ